MIDSRNMTIDKSRRIIVISDIHGTLSLLQSLLTKVKYTTEDYLFIIGDLCEKGPDSLGVVSFVQRLSMKSERVLITKGNCDSIFKYMFTNGFMDIEAIRSYIKRQKNSILVEMLVKHDKKTDDFSTVEELSTFYRQHFGDVIDWIDSLPIAYETDDSILIHAGIERLSDWKETSLQFALYGSSFYEKGHNENKLVIVGHWPVVNYTADKMSSHSPIINEDKKIIALDGGNQIKKDGQLNALLIDKGIYSYTYVDQLKEQAIIQHPYHDSTKRVGTVTYPNYLLQPLQKEEYFTRCLNLKLGIEQWIKNEFLVINENETTCKGDVSTSFLSVEREDNVSVIDNECDGFTLIKKDNGDVGWIPKNCIN